MENPEIIKWLEKRSINEGECEGNSLYRDAAAALRAAEAALAGVRFALEESEEYTERIPDGNEWADHYRVSNALAVLNDYDTPKATA